MQEIPEPRNVSELKSYIGLLSFYSNFLPNLSTVLALLYQLLRKDQSWIWNSLKLEHLKNRRICFFLHKSWFILNLDICLACDAFDYGIGAVLSHRMSDDSEKPIGFVSRTLSDAEKKNSQIEKEALACVVGVQRFRSGHNFILQTDHKPLLTLFNENKLIPQQAAGRIQCWTWIPASYKYTITWRNTTEHANADALSRLPLPQIPANTSTPAELVLLIEN